MKRFFFLFSAFLSFLFLATPVAAQVCDSNAPGFGCLEDIFSNVVRAVIALAVVALFVMLLVGGFKFIFSGGDAKQTEQAKSTITAAILGVVVVAVAYLILQLIGTFTNTNVTKFEIPLQ